MVRNQNDIRTKKRVTCARQSVVAGRMQESWNVGMAKTRASRNLKTKRKRIGQLKHDIHIKKIGEGSRRCQTVSLGSNIGWWWRWRRGENNARETRIKDKGVTKERRKRVWWEWKLMLVLSLRQAMSGRRTMVASYDGTYDNERLLR